MLRTAICFAAALALPAPAWVAAQVAAPSIAPASIRIGFPGDNFPEATFAPENPAATQFGAPSAIGGGQVNAKTEVSPAGTTTDHEATYAGFRWVTDGLSFAAEGIDQSEKNATDDVSVVEGALSFPLMSQVAFGGSFATVERDTGANKVSQESLVAGIGAHIDERIYFGFALGRDVYSDSGTNIDSDREVRKFGIGYRVGGGDTAWHLEYYAIDRDPHKTAAGAKFDDTDVVAMVLEVNWNNLLLAANKSSITSDNNDREHLIVDAGWAPLEGFALLGHWERNEEDLGGGSTRTVEVTGFSVAYQF